MKVKMLCINEDNFEESLNNYINMGWKPKFESYNIYKAYDTIWHYILLVKE